MAKISIIVPVYNVEKYVRTCLDSLLSQTMQNIEIICIDDASPDQSGQILDEYKDMDDRIKVIHVEENVGTLHARILGVEKSVGEHIMFVDSDDTIETTTCEELLKILEEYDVDVLHFGTSIVADDNISEELKTWVTQFLLPYDGLIESDNLIEKCFVKEQFDFNITNKLWKRGICEQAFSMAEKVRLVASEDRYIFFLLMYYAKSYYGTTRKYYHYNLGIGVTGGDILSLVQFEKRCSGVQASKLVTSFLSKVGEEERFAAEAKEFANKILWDCVDCWHNKLTETDLQKGFGILQKYFAPNELVNAIARVYFEQGEDIYRRAQITGGQRVAVYYRYLGYDNMDAKVWDCIFRLKQRGMEVLLYTDADRQNLITDADNFGVDVIYLPNSVDANWDGYENRCNAFYDRLVRDEIKILIYASPTSHIYLLDTLLAALSGISVVDMSDEIYLDSFGKEIQKLCQEKEELNRKKEEFSRKVEELQTERDSLRKQFDSPRAMLRGFWKSCKNRFLSKR